MYSVTAHLDFISVYEIEEIPQNVIAKAAIADVSSRLDGSQWIVTIEKTNGKDVDLLMGTLTELTDWTNDITGASRAMSIINNWRMQ